MCTSKVDIEQKERAFIKQNLSATEVEASGEESAEYILPQPKKYVRPLRAQLAHHNVPYIRFGANSKSTLVEKILLLRRCNFVVH